MSYTPSEMMIVAAARALAGVRTVFVGVGLPNIACNLARYTVAPNLELIYEAGVYGARVEPLQFLSKSASRPIQESASSY